MKVQIEVGLAKRILIGLIIVLVLVVGLLVVFSLTKDEAGDDVPSQPNVDRDTVEAVSYRINDIASHGGSVFNCQTAVDGRVYEVTDFVLRHEHTDTLKSACGGDGTRILKDLGSYEAFTGEDLPETVTWVGVLRYVYADLQEHFAQAHNCYTIVDQKVYDITDYITDHPQAEQLTAICGGIGDQEFTQLDVYQSLGTDQQPTTIIFRGDLEYY